MVSTRCVRSAHRCFPSLPRGCQEEGRPWLTSAQPQLRLARPVARRWYSAPFPSHFGSRRRKRRCRRMLGSGGTLRCGAASTGDRIREDDCCARQMCFFSELVVLRLVFRRRAHPTRSSTPEVHSIFCTLHLNVKIRTCSFKCSCVPECISQKFSRNFVAVN